MSRFKRISDPSRTACRRSRLLAAACAALVLMPVEAAVAQQTDATPSAPQSIQTEPPAEPPVPSLAGEDHSGHMHNDDTPGAPDAPGDIVLEPIIDAAPAATPVAAAPLEQAATFLRRGGPAIWSISLLSVVALALILWKVWRLALMGAWTGGGRAQRAVALWSKGREQDALATLSGRRTCRATLARVAMEARRDGSLDDEGARSETERVARNLIAQAKGGLRPLELIATIAPLLGLLGTVLGMIAAFQALQEAGSRADPAILAGGIWEALLTTAAGMAVAIPASMALTWFESVVDRLRLQMEDAATRIFLRPTASPAPQAMTRAAE